MAGEGLSEEMLQRWWEKHPLEEVGENLGALKNGKWAWNEGGENMDASDMGDIWGSKKR